MFLQVGLPITRMSRLYQTPGFPAGSGPDYVNAAALILTAEPAGTILERLHRIEACFGRERAQRWGPRTLDLDLLAVGEMVCPDAAVQTAWRTLTPDSQRHSMPDQLILPHPRLQDRAFVLVPLAEIAPDWRHPLTNLTVRQMLLDLPKAEIAAISAL